jgi:hypothetical protein
MSTVMNSELLRSYLFCSIVLLDFPKWDSLQDANQTNKIFFSGGYLDLMTFNVLLLNGPNCINCNAKNQLADDLMIRSITILGYASNVTSKNLLLLDSSEKLKFDIVEMQKLKQYLRKFQAFYQDFLLANYPNTLFKLSKKKINRLAIQNLFILNGI